MAVGHPVIIAGGGIGGLATALTLHQIGVPCVVYEAVREMRPLGVGINLQPNAVRELDDLGIGGAELDRVGLPAREWALVGLNGNDIYSEPRGLLAGYHWPQYAVHRGRFHMLLHDKVVERIGPVALLGDAAHAMYPTGSNGGSQAIVDARVLGAAMVAHGATPEALAAYDAKLCGPISQLVLRNRGAGPFGLLAMVDERCGGKFDDIDAVIPPAASPSRR